MGRKRRKCVLTVPRNIDPKIACQLSAKRKFVSVLTHRLYSSWFEPLNYFSLFLNDEGGRGREKGALKCMALEISRLKSPTL